MRKHGGVCRGLQHKMFVLECTCPGVTRRWNESRLIDSSAKVAKIQKYEKTAAVLLYVDTTEYRPTYRVVNGQVA